LKHNSPIVALEMQANKWDESFLALFAPGRCFGRRPGNLRFLINQSSS
jgi:hypothetical protein